LYGPLTGVRCAWLKQKMHAAAIDRYIAVSSEVERRLRDDLGVSQARLSVVHNGIETAPERPQGDASLKVWLQRGSGLPVVLTVARLHGQKGHDHLLAAATLVPDAVFVLAGDGPERDRLQDRARQLGLADRVRFLGQRGDVAALLDACDVFVLPSLYEGLPLSVLEAMAAGKPVVATSVGGTDEVLIDGVNGRLVPPADARSLASAIAAMLSDPVAASRMAFEGRARVSACFSAEAMARGVEQVYTNDLARLRAGEQRQFA
jgi:glycosyltransferase involved in cell wall biosynthesis